MTTLTKPGVAALLAGAAIIPVLNAHAVQHTADFTLQAAPAVVTLTHTSNTDFGTVTIPTGRHTVSKAPRTNGVVTISNAIVGATYSLTVKYAACLSGVRLEPSVVYGDKTMSAGTTADITYAAGKNELDMGGTLYVDETATAGPDTCFYTMTIAVPTTASGG